jgi:hypothetical protein
VAKSVVRGDLRGHFQYGGLPKKSYPSEREANTAMIAMRNDPSFRSSKRQVLNVYKCEDCPNWHIGHKRARAQ